MPCVLHLPRICGKSRTFYMYIYILIGTAPEPELGGDYLVRACAFLAPFKN